MTIYSKVSEPKNASYPSLNRPGFRSGNDYLLTFQSLKNRILASSETAGLPFAKWRFFPMFRNQKKVSTPKSNSPFSVRKVTISGLFEPEEPYSRLRRYGQLTVCEMNIFPDVSVSKNFPPERWNGRVPVREVTILNTFSSLRNRIIASRETVGFPFAKMTIFLTFRYLKTFLPND